MRRDRRLKSGNAPSPASVPTALARPLPRRMRGRMSNNDLCTDEYCYDVSSSGGCMLRASQWHSLRISSTSWMARCRKPGGRPGRIGTPALRTALFFGPRLPMGEPHGVAGDVIECIDNGHEAADEVLRTDHAVIDDLLALPERRLSQPVSAGGMTRWNGRGAPGHGASF